MGGLDYSVDLGELDAVTSDLDRSQERLQTQLDALDRLVASLRGVWQGDTADAQQRAHATWSSQARSMHEALVTLHRAAQVAHGNYSGAVSANVAMWKQVQ